MTLRGSAILSAALIVLITALPVVAQDEAQDEAQSEGQSEWLGWVQIYTGINQVNGTNTVGDISFGVDSRSGDLEWVWGFSTGAWKGRWGGQVEMNWTSVEHSDVLYSDGQITVNGSLEASNLILEADAFFRALGGDAKGLDIIAGVRSYRMENSWAITSNQVQFGSIDDNGSVNESWVDPLIAVRVVGNTDNQFWGAFRVEMGGFGVGSDPMWGIRAQAGLRWQQTDWSLGLRHYDIKYNNGESGDAYFSTDSAHSQFLFIFGYRFSDA